MKKMTAKLYKLRRESLISTRVFTSLLNDYHNAQQKMEVDQRMYVCAMKENGLCPSCQKETLEYSGHMNENDLRDYCSCVYLA